MGCHVQLVKQKRLRAGCPAGGRPLNCWRDVVALMNMSIKRNRNRKDEKNIWNRMFLPRKSQPALAPPIARDLR